MDLRLGALPHALTAGPFDVVVCNPPYMPVGRHAIEVIPTAAAPAAAMTGIRFWIRCATGCWSCCGR